EEGSPHRSCDPAANGRRGGAPPPQGGPPPTLSTRPQQLPTLTTPYFRVIIRIYGGMMSPLDHDHPVNAERVATARAGVLSVAEAGRLAGLLGMLADPVRSRVLFALVAPAEPS